MAISLSKGGNVSLTKEAPGLTAIMVGLGWDVKATDGAKCDLDAMVFACNKDGKVRSDPDFIFYGNLQSTDGTIKHLGDNLTGDGDGDDEQIRIDLAGLAADIEKVVVAVTIHEAEKRKQNFGQVEKASIRIVNTTNDEEIADYDLTEDCATQTAMIFGEIYRHDGDWKFKSIGDGFAGGLKALATNYGVNVA